MTLQAHLITLFFSFLLMLNWKSWPHPYPYSSPIRFRLIITRSSLSLFQTENSLENSQLSLKNVFCKLCSFLIFLHNFCICWHQLMTLLSIDLSRVCIKMDAYLKLYYQQLSKHEKDTLILLNLGVLSYEMKTGVYFTVRLTWPVYRARDQAVAAVSTISGLCYKGKMKVQCYKEAQINQLSKYIFKNFTSNSKKLFYLADISRIMTKLEG